MSSAISSGAPRTETPPAPAATRAAALKQATAALHEKVDTAMMAGEPMSGRERYARFVAVQYRFHQLTRHYFGDPVLNGWFPGLAARERLAAVEQDCRDLGLDPAQLQEPPLPAPQGPEALARAVGWLYVNEGSNLGAAFLYKRALQLGLDAQFGARHLAPHPDGRMPHWQQFVAQLNAAPLAPEHEALAIEGARQAFERVIALARPLAQAG
ncbi:biliverdin-producing heme oxygenase [Orrella sp. JC864]|uniref:biliverdin-producing heme oxygenase n=1 Tax=Orrella sp. JC864 TaxID=3120298 RepID=UPI003008306E